MFTALIAAAATTAFGAFTEGVAVGITSYAIAKKVGKVNLSFKKSF